MTGRSPGFADTARNLLALGAGAALGTGLLLVAAGCALAAGDAAGRARLPIALGLALTAAAAITVGWLGRRTEPDPPRVPPAAPVTRSTWVLDGALLLLVVIAATYRIDSIPGLRPDEALSLQFVANSVRYGHAGIFLEGPEPTSGFTFLGTGVTVLAPLWVLFRTLGVSLVVSRVIATLSLGALAWAVDRIARHAGGPAAGRIALLWLLAFPETWNTGRQVLGDFLAAAFLLAAIAGLGRARPFRAGVAFGLVLLTKISFAVAGFGLVAAWADGVARGQRPRFRGWIGAALIAIVVVAPYEAYKLARSSSILTHASTSGWGQSYLSLAEPAASWVKLKEAAKRPEILALMLGIGLLGRLRPRGDGDVARAVAAVGLVTLAWFVLFDIRLHRYLIVPSLTGVVLAGVVGAALLARVPRPLGLALAVPLVVWPAARMAREVVTVAHTQVVADPVVELLQSRVGPGDAVYAENFPLELAFLSGRRVIPLRAEAGWVRPGSYVLARALPQGCDAVASTGGLELSRCVRDPFAR